MRTALSRLSRCIVIAGLIVCGHSNGAPIDITLDTASLSGVSALLAFDFIDGGSPSNSVSVSGFSSDGVLGASSSTGDVSGTLPGTVQFGDTQFFNEYLQSIELGSTLTFAFEDTGHAADLFSSPDSFALFLLDAVSGNPLYATGDPTGADALFRYDVGEPNPLHIFSSTVSGPNIAREPTTAWLAFAAMLGFATNSRLRRVATRPKKYFLPPSTTPGDAVTPT